MSKYIDESGLNYLWGKVKAAIPDVSGKENTSNKVTSISASSTDTEYPSAKCVWDLVGDIETILASI